MRHIRNGVELDPIDLNRNYDFDYQQTNSIPRVQVLPVSSYTDIKEFWLMANHINSN